MKKNFKAVKTSLIMGILLVSLLFVFVPTGSAGILQLQPKVVVDYDSEDAKGIITPVETTLDIKMYITYQVEGPFVVSQNIPEYLDATTEASIDLEVDQSSVPSYCTASIKPSTVSAPITETPERAYPQALLQVSVSEDAPGFVDIIIKVKAHANPVKGLLFNIPEDDAIGEVRVKPTYAALISIEEPEGNFLEIGPADTADFPITVENLGNAVTEVTFEILDLPKGWSPNIQEYMVLGSGTNGENSQKTVTLRVKPPYGFGYHDERTTIRVRVTPSYQRDPDLVGKIYTLNFTVHNRGFSAPIFESTMALTAVILVGLIVFYLMRRRKR